MDLHLCFFPLLGIHTLEFGGIQFHANNRPLLETTWTLLEASQPVRSVGQPKQYLTWPGLRSPQEKGGQSNWAEGQDGSSRIVPEYCKINFQMGGELVS